MIGALNMVLKSADHQYIFTAPRGINGWFYFVVDLHDVAPGDYAIYMAGAVIDGMDANGPQKKAYSPTGYMITVK